MGSIVKKRLIDEKEKFIPMDKRVPKPVLSALDSDAIIGSNAFEIDQQDVDGTQFALDVTGENVLRGIIYSEILAKPLSLRKK